MKKSKRFIFSITDEIIGKDFAIANEICQFNGYLLYNSESIKESYDLRVVTYELEDGKIVNAYLKNKI
jgi:hypothetical protein